MAIFKVPEAFTYARNAGADLSAQLHKIAHIDTDGDIILCPDGDIPAGVIIEGAVANKPCSIQFGGIAKVECSTTVTAGVLVASSGSGEAAPATADEHVLGIALETGGDGDVIPVLIRGGLGV